MHALADVARPLVLGGAWLGGYTGWVIRGPTQLPRAREHPQIPAERAPEAPAGAGVGGYLRVGPTLRA